MKKKLDKKSFTKCDGVLDKLWRSVGKKEAVCEVCATLPEEQRVNYTKLDPHHIVKRGHHTTRWDLRNRVWLCARHHTLGQKTAEYNEAGWFFSTGECWLRKYRSEDCDYLLSLKHTTSNFTMDELMEIYNKLKEMEGK